MDLEENAVECTDRACGIPFSASAMRELISDLREESAERASALKALSEFIPADKINDLLSIFEPLKEESGSGAIGGHSGPLSTSGKKKPGKRDKVKRRTMIRQENIDLTLIDEVMELLIERGIVQ